MFDRLVDKFDAERDARAATARSQLVALLMAQTCDLESLCDIETAMASHSLQLYHMGSRPVSRSALAAVNAQRSPETFDGLLAALISQLQTGYRRKVADCGRVIDSTSVKLSSLTKGWARFSGEVCGAKAHIGYDPNANQPVYRADPSRGHLWVRSGLLRFRRVGQARRGRLPDGDAAEPQHALQRRRRA